MKVIYLTVKFEFDWTNCFPAVGKRKMWTDRQTDIGHIKLIGRLVTCNPPKKIHFKELKQWQRIIHDTKTLFFHRAKETSACSILSKQKLKSHNPSPLRHVVGILPLKLELKMHISGVWWDILVLDEGYCSLGKIC